MRAIEEEQSITAWENKEENTAYDDIYHTKFRNERMESQQIKVVTLDNKKKMKEVRKSKTKHFSTKIFNQSDYLQREKETLKRYLNQRDSETKKNSLGEIHKQANDKNDHPVLLSYKEARVQNKTIIFEGFPSNNQCKNDSGSQNKFNLFSGSTSKKYKRKFIYYEGHKQASSFNGLQPEILGRRQLTSTAKASKILMSEPDKRQKLKKFLKFPLFYRQIDNQAQVISRKIKHKSSIDILQKDNLHLFVKNSFQFKDDNLFSSKIIRY